MYVFSGISSEDEGLFFAKVDKIVSHIVKTIEMRLEQIIMVRSIAIASGKGGVGKTSLAVNCAVKLSLNNNRVFFGC